MTLPSPVTHHSSLIMHPDLERKLYYDGILQGINTNFLLTPEDLGTTVSNYLGRSQYSVDPTMNGGMAEFRIYNGDLDAYSIAAHFVNGPDTLSTNIGLCTNLTASVPYDPIDQFGIEQITVLGQFDSGNTIRYYVNGVTVSDEIPLAPGVVVPTPGIPASATQVPAARPSSQALQ